MELMGVAFAIVSGPTLAAEASGGISELGVSWSSLLWQIAGFLILLFILSKYAYKPFLKAIDERRARAQEIVDKSDQIKKEALDSEQRTREIISNAQREAQSIIATANTRQQQILEETAAKKRQVEEQEIAKARAQIAAERDQAIQQLRREFSDLAVLAASRIVRRELTTNPKLQSELINEVLGAQSQPKKAGGR
ncbi:MAG: F0F1 ATP synthase subunit B [Chloroflexota bacterium]|nr:F0F1 ATP synthase subunit B [Chloroflexota bacterium]